MASSQGSPTPWSKEGAFNFGSDLARWTHLGWEDGDKREGKRDVGANVLGLKCWVGVCYKDREGPSLVAFLRASH